MNAKKAAVVAPNIIDESSPNKQYKWLNKNKSIPFIFSLTKSEESNFLEVTVAITSGSLMNVKAYKEIGPLIDDLFIDYVDTEYCLRAQLKGYKILVNTRANLYHNLGNRQEVSFLNKKIYPTFHNPIRRYYIARNRIFMIRKYSLLFPHWLLFDIVAEAYNSFRIIFFENQRILKLQLHFKGLL